MDLKHNIKNRRLELDMTLEEVAKIVGVTRQTIQKYESGVVTNIPSDKIELLAAALKTTPTHLMGWENNANITSSKQKAHELIDAIPDEKLNEIMNYLRYIKDSSDKQ